MRPPPQPHLWHNYAMNKTVLIRFVPPAPITVKTGKATTHTRHWHTDKLIAHLQEHLELRLADAGQTFDLRVVSSTQPEIRFEGWKPEKADDLRKVIGDLMGEVMQDIEVEEFLQA